MYQKELENRSTISVLQTGNIIAARVAQERCENENVSTACKLIGRSTRLSPHDSRVEREIISYEYGREQNTGEREKGKACVYKHTVSSKSVSKLVRRLFSLRFQLRIQCYNIILCYIIILYIITYNNNV